MDLLTALDDAQHAFADRLALVRDDQWSLPSVCRSWTVFGLASHTISATRTYAALHAGATRDQATSVFIAEVDGDDLLGAYRSAAAQVLAGFREPGVFERTFPHPTLDMPGSQLIVWRILDDTLHAWDLARSIGADERLPDSALEVIWAFVEPLVSVVGGHGVFGDGQSGTVDPDADLQTRVLDALGRRP